MPHWPVKSWTGSLFLLPIFSCLGEPVPADSCSSPVVAHPFQGLKCCAFWVTFLLTMVVKNSYLSCYNLPMSLNQSGHCLFTLRKIRLKMHFMWTIILDTIVQCYMVHWLREWCLCSVALDLLLLLLSAKVLGNALLRTSHTSEYIISWSC